MTTLALRLIGPSDYVVIDEGHRVGRIRRAAERINEVWLWNVTVAVPGGGHGTSTLRLIGPSDYVVIARVVIFA